MDPQESSLILVLGSLSVFVFAVELVADAIVPTLMPTKADQFVTASFTAGHNVLQSAQRVADERERLAVVLAQAIERVAARDHDAGGA